jgi:hypothetical protein
MAADARAGNIGMFACFYRKKSLPKPILEACHDVPQMGFVDFVVHRATIPHVGQKTTTLHQPQVIRRGGLAQLALIRDFVDRILFSRQQQLYDLQPTRMGQRFEAVGRLA